MKRIFNRLTSLVLVLAMIAPMLPILTFAASGEHFPRTSDLINGNLSLNFSSLNSIGDINSLSGWSGYFHNLDEYPGAGIDKSNSTFNFKKFTGAVYSDDILYGRGYNLSYTLQASVSTVERPFAVFFRGDVCDQEMYKYNAKGKNTRDVNKHTEAYTFSNADEKDFINGSGIGLWVSGQHQLSIVIKRVKLQNYKLRHGQDSTIINFVTEHDLTKPVKYTVADNGSDRIAITIEDAELGVEPICYLTLSDLDRYVYDGDAKNSFTDFRYDSNNNIIGTATGDTASEDLTPYYKTVKVYTPSGVFVGGTDHTLIRNYSRIVMAGYNPENDHIMGNVNLTAHDTSAFDSNSALLKSNSVYMPITIRDFASDGMLFEFRNVLNENEDYTQEEAYNTISPPSSQIATHSTDLLQTHSNEYFGTSYKRSHFSVYLPIHNTISGQNANPKDGFYIKNMEAQGRNSDGSYRFELGANEAGHSNSWMKIQLSDAGYVLNDFYGIFVAFKFPDISQSELKKVKMKMYAGAVDTTDYDSNYCYIVDFSEQVTAGTNAGSAGDYYGYPAAHKDQRDYGVLGKCNEEGYEDYYIAFFPTLKGGGYRSGETNYDGGKSLNRLRFDVIEPDDTDNTSWGGKHIDILYITLFAKERGSGKRFTTNDSSLYCNEGDSGNQTSKTVLNGMQKSLLQGNTDPSTQRDPNLPAPYNVSSGHGYSIYPTMRTRIRASAENSIPQFDLKLDVSKGSSTVNWLKSYKMISIDAATTRTTNSDGSFSYSYTPDNGWNISGYFYIRYRVSKEYAGAEFSIKDLDHGEIEHKINVKNKDGTTTTVTERGYPCYVHNEPYIVDGKWHDLIIPVRLNHTDANQTKITNVRFEFLSNPEEVLYTIDKNGNKVDKAPNGCIIDLGAFRYYTWKEMEDIYNVGTDTSDTDQTNHAVFTKLAKKGSGINTYEPNAPVTKVENSDMQWGLFTAASYSQNGRLYLLSHTDRGTHEKFSNEERLYGNNEFQMPWVGHNKSQAGFSELGGNNSYFVALRYRTDTPIPEGVTVHFARTLEIEYSGYYTFNKTFIPVADGKWHTAIINIEDYEARLGGRHITDVYLEFQHYGKVLERDSGGNVVRNAAGDLVYESETVFNGARHIEVAELCFYRDRRSATYYNNDYAQLPAGTTFADMSGFGLLEGDKANGGTAISLPNSFSSVNVTGRDETQAQDRNTAGTASVLVSQGLVKPELTKDSNGVVTGNLEYTDDVAVYLAQLIQKYLYLDDNKDGKPNTGDVNLKYAPEDMYGNKKYDSLLGDESVFLGEKSGLGYPVDLATLLRNFCTAQTKLGTTSAEMQLARTFTDLKSLRMASGTTYYEIAKFLLKNMFTDEFGQPVETVDNNGNIRDEFSAIRLTQGVEYYGEDPGLYIFNSAYYGTMYTDDKAGSVDGIIYNVQDPEILAYNRDDGLPLVRENMIPGRELNPGPEKKYDLLLKYDPTNKYTNYDDMERRYYFNPIGTGRRYNMDSLGAGDSNILSLQSVDKYTDFAFAVDSLIENVDTNMNIRNAVNVEAGYNYHFSLESRTKFTYLKDKNYFFEIIADDDVYLFIDGKLVIDQGGVHSAVGVGIEMNDLRDVNGDPIILEEGKSYNFDLFYIERHAPEANFVISTNIEFASPPVEVDKKAYQTFDDGERLELTDGDNVVTDHKVEYSFEITNKDKEKGDMPALPIHSISFVDSVIGIEILSDGTVNYNAETITFAPNAAIIHYENNNSTVTASLNDNSPSGKAARKALLESQIQPDETVKVTGILYDFSKAPNNRLTNTVDINFKYTSITNDTAERSEEASFTLNDSLLHIYLLQGEPREFNIFELVNDSTYIGKTNFGQFFSDAADGTSEYSNATLTLCDLKQNDISHSNDIYLLNGSTHTNTVGDLKTAYVAAQSQKNISVKSNASSGTERLFSFKINIKNDSDEMLYDYGPFTVIAHTYEAQLSTYVLDYGLPVVVPSGLTDSEHTDTPYVDVNALKPNGAHATDIKLLEFGAATSNYGNISTENNGDITYTPNKFIEGSDTVDVILGITEDQTASDPYSITKGIRVPVTVTFLPANVMYYEESISSITYGNGMQKTNNSSKNYFQTADQSSPYGYDSGAYHDDTTTASNATPGSFKWYGSNVVSCGPIINGGSNGFDNYGYNYNFSNGTYAYIDTTPGNNGVPKRVSKDPVMTFTFTGKGFELISYTNLSSAIIDIAIYAGDEVKYKEVNEKKVKYPMYARPVVLTYTAGELYQVPVFKWNTDTHGTYTVEVCAANSINISNPMYRTFYFDGIRIYDPITDVSKYNEKEQNTQIYPVKDLIVNNETNAGAAVGTVGIDDNGKEYYAYIGTEGSVVEKLFTDNGAGWGTSGGEIGKVNNTDSFKEYLYDTVGPNHECYIAKNTALLFNVKPDPNYRGERTFQVETRLIDPNTTKANNFSGVSVKYTTGNGGVTKTYNVDTYTSMYYELALDVPTDGAMISVSPTSSTVCITNIKVNGYILSKVDPEGKSGDLNTEKVYDAMFDVVDKNNATYNDSLEILSAKMSVNADAVTVEVIASSEATNAVIYTAGGEAVNCTSTSNGTYGNFKKFTVTFTAPSTAGEYKYRVAVKDGKGQLSKDYVLKTVNVKNTAA